MSSLGLYFLSSQVEDKGSVRKIRGVGGVSRDIWRFLKNDGSEFLPISRNIPRENELG